MQSSPLIFQTPIDSANNANNASAGFGTLARFSPPGCRVSSGPSLHLLLIREHKCLCDCLQSYSPRTGKSSVFSSQRIVFRTFPPFSVGHTQKQGPLKEALLVFDPLAFKHIENLVGVFVATTGQIDNNDLIFAQRRCQFQCFSDSMSTF